MALVRTLFGKILLWSVSVQLVTFGTILALVTFYLPESQEAVDNAFSLYADTAVALYERFGPEALDKFLAHSGESTLLTLKLSATSPGMECGPKSKNSTSIMAHGHSGTYCLTVHAETGGLPASRESRRSRLQLTILLELLSCAGLSYFIARYLSRPISDLRQAATRLAKGDLSARVGAKFSGRRDEAADLVREFDQMADRMVALIEAQRRLIGDVSHEIKSPLARLNMALGLARRDAEDHAPKQFERMQREVNNISRLVGELLILASLDAAEKTLDDPVNIGEVITNVLADIAYESPERVSDLAFQKPDHDIIVLGDKALLGRAIENVLRNAVFYTAAGASIEISCDASSNADRVQITILDHGPGVPEQALANLFDPFYRVDDARTRQTGGTGIGLAICRRAVELHHGNVCAKNTEPHGLSVVINLPQVRHNAISGHISTQLHDRLS